VATNFPTSLDSITNPTASDKLNSPSHSSQHSTVNDAVEALEAKVGVNSSAVATRLDYLVKNASSSNPGHKHTLANGATDITATKDELNYSSGVTSAIQTQLNAKALKGANSDITSLSGLTTALSVAQGGTGIKTGTAFGVICAGTTATGAFQVLNSLGTLGQVLTSAGAGALPSWQSTTLYGVYTASDTLLLSADTERVTSDTSYAKLKEMRVIYSGTYRVKYDLKSGSGFGRIYKNGVAYGTEYSTSAGVYETKSEDLAFAQGDLIQIYAKKSSADAYIRNFRLYGDIITSSSVITD